VSVSLLQQVPLFRKVAPEELAALSKIAEERAVPAGGSLFEEGSASDGLCVIVTGKIEIWKRAFDGAPQHLSTLGPGDTIGEMSLLDGEPRSASAKAAEAATVLLFRRDDFHQYLIDRPALGVQFLLRIVRMLTGRLRRTSQELADVVSLSSTDLETH